MSTSVVEKRLLNGNFLRIARYRQGRKHKARSLRALVALVLIFRTESVTGNSGSRIGQLLSEAITASYNEISTSLHFDPAIGSRHKVHCASPSHLPTILSTTKSALKTARSSILKFIQRKYEPFPLYRYDRSSLNFYSHEDGRHNHLAHKSSPAHLRRIRGLSGEKSRSLLTIQQASTTAMVKKRVILPLSKELCKSGIYFGLAPQTVKKLYNTEPLKKRIDLREGMMEALDELRTMRREMEELRKEMVALQKRLNPESDLDDDKSIEILKTRSKTRKRELEKIGKEVEEWAKVLLLEQLPQYGRSTSTVTKAAKNIPKDLVWEEVKCTKLLQSKFNPAGKSHAYLTYMKDSRGVNSSTGSQSTKSKRVSATGNADLPYDPDAEYPCLKMYSTIDAPIEDVCVYLSSEKHLWDYNSLLERHEDVEVVSSNGKICWAQTPQILFVKPRSLVTYCTYKWLKDDTQIILSQAVDHDKIHVDAIAFRGATIIRRDPEYPNDKTNIYMLAHASPGSDVPAWTFRTAAKSLASIEPFRLFSRLNQAIQESRPELRMEIERLRKEYAKKNSFTSASGSTDVSSMVRNDDAFTQQQPSDSIAATTTQLPAGAEEVATTARTHWLPGGIAQLGYACFWPNGGGPIEDTDDDAMVTPIVLSLNESGGKQLMVTETKAADENVM